MKKIGLLFKETSENRIKNSIKEASSVFVVKYSGVDSPDICNLRQSLRQAQAELFVVKNSVARRALKNAGLDFLVKAVDGPCALVFAKKEPVETSRVLYTFTKEHGELKLEGGMIKDRVLEGKDIETLARLPSKDILRAQVIMTLNSPISGLVISLSQTLRKIVVCLDQIKQKKGN